MKKSKIDPKDVLKDADKLLNLINNLEELNLENTDLDKFEEEIDEEPKDDLDTEE